MADRPLLTDLTVVLRAVALFNHSDPSNKGPLLTLLCPSSGEKKIKNRVRQVLSPLCVKERTSCCIPAPLAEQGRSCQATCTVGYRGLADKQLRLMNEAVATGRQRPLQENGDLISSGGGGVYTRRWATPPPLPPVHTCNRPGDSGVSTVTAEGCSITSAQRHLWTRGGL